MKGLGRLLMCLALRRITPYHLGRLQISSAFFLLGKDGPRERTGVYANEPALRAMAAISWKNLVVVNSCSGSNLEHPELHDQPPDKVTVYQPGHSNEQSELGG